LKLLKEYWAQYKLENSYLRELEMEDTFL